ncbi:MAG: hypothetical protein DI587_31260 [Variovorax paradoxus]|nr:MAG: hypothetical protein DI583_31260 [Variovorax paradoxus]PZQ03140.1 MAG: hypothetical protein DI587_31260 [Variovorax paradoxus]
MSTKKERREADRQRRAAVVTTGRVPDLLQDGDRRLSRWLASRPDAMQRAREAAAQIKACTPTPTDTTFDISKTRNMSGSRS